MIWGFTYCTRASYESTGNFIQAEITTVVGNMKVSFKGMSCECCTAILIIVVPSILIFSELHDAESYEVNR